MRKPAIKPAIDRVPTDGGAPCPRYAAIMQRFRRADGYISNAAPFACVRLWDRCTCGWIERLSTEPKQ